MCRGLNVLHVLKCAQFAYFKHWYCVYCALHTVIVHCTLWMCILCTLLLWKLWRCAPCECAPIVHGVFTLHSEAYLPKWSLQIGWPQRQLTCQPVNNLPPWHLNSSTIISHAAGSKNSHPNYLSNKFRNESLENTFVFDVLNIPLKLCTCVFIFIQHPKGRTKHWFHEFVTRYLQNTFKPVYIAAPKNSQ